MNDDINRLIYYGNIMQNFTNFIKSFGKFQETNEKDPMEPSYIKPDGTKVVEQVSEFGKTVYEINPIGLLISRSYTPDGRMYFDYGRKANFEIGHAYDEFGNVTSEVTCLYNEHNVQVKKTEIKYEYHDNGKKAKETTTVIPGDIKT